MNRRTFLKKSVGTLLAAVGLGGGTYYYAREIEPGMLAIHHEQIISSKIPDAFHNFKIVQFSDTHIGYHYSLDQLTELIKTINDHNPDVIVFTGDLVDEPDTYHWNNELIQTLQALHARIGKYWIYGNHDHGGYGTNLVKNVMDKANFRLLKNNHTTIELDNEKIILSGIDDLILGSPDLEKTLSATVPDLFNMLLAHEPDFADTAVNFPVDVQLSGHSHGGQVRLPFIGDLYTPLYAKKYVQGKHTLNDGKMTLFVSRGVGTTRLPYRFLCKPEINTYTLKAQKS